MNRDQCQKAGNLYTQLEDLDRRARIIRLATEVSVVFTNHALGNTGARDISLEAVRHLALASVEAERTALTSNLTALGAEVPGPDASAAVDDDIPF